MVKTFREFLDELYVRDPSGKIINIRKQKYRGADMKLHSANPGKSSSSGGGGGSGSGGSGGSGNGNGD
jgi:uncharacterized membrane protein